MFFTFPFRLFSISSQYILNKIQTKRYFSAGFGSGKLNSELVLKHKGKTVGLVLANVLLTPTSNEEENHPNKQKIIIPEPAEFSHTFQLQQAASHTINSSITMLNSNFQMLLTVYSEYSNLLELAIKALSIAIEINPSIYDHTRIDDQLSMLRSEMISKKTSISECLFVFGESVKLLQTAANISFLVGNEPSSNLAFSHCVCVQQEVIKSYEIVT